ncbi:hypothetical protein SLEP1_g30723 [Rubroshorea leprosula]|uniref:Uncharacterized protein n=1 Tax=Rubroshorea leprosula TaxID=152421 RepID=A0AAV5K6J3_9ROSI|nr:hypothetical protein SLEP1_g30723 [Rubroshorea leprosula]
MIKGKLVILISLGSINIGPGAGGYNKDPFSGSFSKANGDLHHTDAATFCKMRIAEGMLTVHTTNVCVEEARINAGSETKHLEIDHMIKGTNVNMISLGSINIGPGAGGCNKGSFSASINNDGTKTKCLNIDHTIKGNINVGPGAGGCKKGFRSGTINQMPTAKDLPTNKKTDASREEARIIVGSKTEHLDIDHMTKGENVILISLGSINIGPGAGGYNEGPFSGSINQANGNSCHPNLETLSKKLVSSERQRESRGP